MRSALAKARRLRVLGRGAVTLEPAYQRAVEARERAEGGAMCCVLSFILALITFSVLYIVRENDAERSLLHAATLGVRAPRRAGHGVLAGVLTERFGG